MAKQRQVKMQQQIGTLAAMQQLENRTDEQLQRETKHRAAARALLGARAAERYDAQVARKYFNEALAGAHPQERPYLRQVMKAALAQAERRPDELKEAMEALGQEAPSGRQLFALRLMGLLSPPPNAGRMARVRGIALVVLLVILLIALGFGLAKLVTLPFGGAGTIVSLLIGMVLIVAILGLLALFGRRRQAKAQARALEQRNAAQGKR
jgi:hypothetical protein